MDVPRTNFMSHWCSDVIQHPAYCGADIQKAFLVARLNTLNNGQQYHLLCSSDISTLWQAVWWQKMTLCVIQVGWCLIMSEHWWLRCNWPAEAQFIKTTWHGCQSKEILLCQCARFWLWLETFVAIKSDTDLPMQLGQKSSILEPSFFLHHQEMISSIPGTAHRECLWHEGLLFWFEVTYHQRKFCCALL